MPKLLASTQRMERRSLRLDTLLTLRWLAVAGQAMVIVVVYHGFGYPLPVGWALAAVGISIWLNIALRLKYPNAHRLTNKEAAAILAFDIVQLALLLYLSGGLENPFALLFLGPVLISASALPPSTTVYLGLLALACGLVVAAVHQPLPWAPDSPLRLPPLYQAGVWLAILLGMSFVGVYGWQVAEETRQLTDALTAAELVLAREQHLSALDGLAAAAAHELGTPLATIATVAKELERELPPDSPQADDIRLLREQSNRCRDILRKLTSLGTDEAPFDRMPISLLLEEVAAPHRLIGVSVRIERLADRSSEPVLLRNPGLLYGLGNIIENAVDYAEREVVISIRWTPRDVVVTVVDDGPGFAPDLLGKLGEPYVTARSLDRRKAAAGDQSGLGLGFFIAKTLLERSGAMLTIANRVPPEHGAIVRIGWLRAALDEAAAALPSETQDIS
ncbi:ActS/PrrB/RegB family redox-sensitive histidine kinase [Blastochloris sulfoviridis]|uniref:histidine kinase n=1 Tax=Blastochloris sulfoviridis TaxID=50712 RepID=A0A5M6HWZ7_9HYPH|nr:ActS/PrrB/RegB family redox-sensitive histidine kinase [Blastochloris sulfoviridis]KAA5600433.1 ActS/PrrB/RegB family redox-sensitive histidine kinase [Blastochloris sulfoviridis]